MCFSLAWILEFRTFLSVLFQWDWCFSENNILLESQSSSPEGDNGLQEAMVQSYVSNTHEMLVPPVYTPTDRHPGVKQTLKDIDEGYLVGQMDRRHICKPQQQGANWNRWYDQGQANCCGKARLGGTVNSNNVTLPSCLGFSIVFKVRSRCLNKAWLGLCCSPAPFVFLVPPLIHTHTQCSSLGDPLVSKLCILLHLCLHSFLCLKCLFHFPPSLSDSTEVFSPTKPSRTELCVSSL